MASDGIGRLSMSYLASNFHIMYRDAHGRRKSYHNLSADMLLFTTGHLAENGEAGEIFDVNYSPLAVKRLGALAGDVEHIIEAANARTLGDSRWSRPDSSAPGTEKPSRAGRDGAGVHEFSVSYGNGRFHLVYNDMLSNVTGCYNLQARDILSITGGLADASCTGEDFNPKFTPRARRKLGPWAARIEARLDASVTFPSGK
ncbi:MAG: hypothetical protein V1813_02560 [Candidatus Aenigmatarchaeota archaeon]